MSTRPSSSHERIPSLDGLRAISIAMVYVGHLSGTRGCPISTSTGNFLNVAELGVHVFFVISGFLITGLLLQEIESHGRIDLRRFYLRRTLRIFPAYYALLVAVFVLSLTGIVTVERDDLWRAITYTTNYDAHRSWLLGHTWSLSAEEQFYLLWPAVVLFARPRRAIAIAVLVVLCVPVIRIVFWEFMRASGDSIGARFETIADAIAIGCVLAGVRARLHRNAAYMSAIGSPLFVLVPLVTFGANLLHDHPLVYFGLAFTVVNIGVALCIDWSVTFAEGRIGQVLNAGPLVFVGWLSYSLYLWQQLFLNRTSTALVASFPINLGLAVAAAVASYYWIEQPSLRLRRRLEAQLPPRHTDQPMVTVR